MGEVVGPVTIHVHDELVFEPDLVFIRSDRLEIVDPDGDVHGVPDLIIEVLSPSPRSYDRTLKRKPWATLRISSAAASIPGSIHRPIWRGAGTSTTPC